MFSKASAISSADGKDGNRLRQIQSVLRCQQENVLNTWGQILSKIGLYWKEVRTGLGFPVRGFQREK